MSYDKYFNYFVKFPCIKTTKYCFQCPDNASVGIPFTQAKRARREIEPAK